MRRTWRNWKVSLHRLMLKVSLSLSFSLSRRNSSQPEFAERATYIRPLCRWNFPDMSYWPVHKWTLWILPRNIHRNRSMARNRRGASYRGNRVWAEGARWWCWGTPTNSRMSFSISLWDREEIFESSKTGKIATLLGKESAGEVRRWGCIPLIEIRRWKSRDLPDHASAE